MQLGPCNPSVQESNAAFEECRESCYPRGPSINAIMTNPRDCTFRYDCVCGDDFRGGSPGGDVDTAPGDPGPYDPGPGTGEPSV